MFLYMIFNKINGKIYVGISNNLEKRWKRHKSNAKSKNLARKHAIHHALAKYGFENFIFKSIEQLPDLDTANIKERDWIKTLKDFKYQLYNETDGGDGHLGVKWTDEQKKKASERNSGSDNPMYGVQLFGEDNPNFGKKMKPHVKEGLLKTRRKLSDEQIQEVQSLYSTGDYTQTKLANQFNISLTQIHRIVKGKSWGHKNHDEILTKKNLTLEDVSQIKLLYATDNYTQKELGIRFNCTASHINRILNNKKWKS